MYDGVNFTLGFLCLALGLFGMALTYDWSSLMTLSQGLLLGAGVAAIVNSCTK